MSNFNAPLSRRLSVAPMMEWTDRHARVFFRALSKHTILYSEMVTANALIRGDKDKLLKHNLDEPVALQLGGSSPSDLAECAKFGEDYGYNEINLNAGCPSERVKNAQIGACLIAKPHLVGECLASMQKAVSLPVTLKTRIGLDNNDTYEDFYNYIRIIRDHGCKHVTIHARKAILDRKRTPKENRQTPLVPELVYQLKQDLPDMEICINGDVKSLDDALKHLEHTDGVMIGRAIYANPYNILSEADKKIFNSTQEPKSREEIIEEITPYIESELAKGVRLHNITRHLLGLYNGEKGAKIWRQTLSIEGVKEGADISVIHSALNKMKEQSVTT